MELITAGIVSSGPCWTDFQIGNTYKYYDQEKICPPVFNVMGDSLRVNFENEAIMYMEVISMVPVTVAIMIEGKDEAYVLTGIHKLEYGTNLMGSELTITNNSKFRLVIKDPKEDDVYEWDLPNV